MKAIRIILAAAATAVSLGIVSPASAHGPDHGWYQWRHHQNHWQRPYHHHWQRPYYHHGQYNPPPRPYYPPRHHYRSW